MLMNRIAHLSPAVLILLLVLLPASLSYSQWIEKPPCPKNVILMIGDGMGFNCLRAADCFYGPSSFNGFPVSLAVATYPNGSGYDPSRAWIDTAYLNSGFTESGAAATALATAVRTDLQYIGISPGLDTLMNLTELAKSMGKSAGVITSVPFTHATPAGFVAHNISRSNYPGIAAYMLFRSRCDLIIGCGNPEYDDNGNRKGNRWSYCGYVGDSALWQGLMHESGKQIAFTVDGNTLTVQDINGDGRPDPWTVITRAEDFRKFMSGPTPRRLLGCPEVFSTLQQGRTPADGETHESPPFTTPFIQRMPTLAEMVNCGLNLLDDNPAGFFVMIEGGAIDWANHENQKGRMLEEMKSFRDAVDSVIAWVDHRSSWDETLLIITADHESGNLWGGAIYSPVISNGTGRMPALHYHSGDHTNALVPLFAKGAGASLLLEDADQTDPVRGKYILNTEIPGLIFRIWTKNK